MRKAGEVRDCKKCDGNLWEENNEAFSIYGIVADQVMVAMDGTPLGLNFNAVAFVFDIYEIENRKVTFEKILLIHSIMRETLKKENK